MIVIAGVVAGMLFVLIFALIDDPFGRREQRQKDAAEVEDMTDEAAEHQFCPLCGTWADRLVAFCLVVGVAGVTNAVFYGSLWALGLPMPFSRGGP